RPRLLLLADHDDGRVLDRAYGERARALRGHLPDRSLAGRGVPRLAALQRDVPRADRVRGHGARGGADVAPALADAAARGGVRVRAVRVHPLVLAVRLAPLFRRVGLIIRREELEQVPVRVVEVVRGGVERVVELDGAVDLDTRAAHA